MIGLPQKTAAATTDFFSTDIIMIGTACEISVTAGNFVAICVKIVISTDKILLAFTNFISVCIIMDRFTKETLATVTFLFYG